MFLSATAKAVQEQIAKLQSKIFVPQRQSTSWKYLNYHPPDVNLLKIAQQDHALKHMNLVDERFITLLHKEKRMKANGKKIRVSILTGIQKKIEEKKKGKKGKR